MQIHGPPHGFRFEVNPYGIRDVAVSNVLIERADTYDAAVGGVPGFFTAQTTPY